MSKRHGLEAQYQRNIALIEEILEYEATNIVMEAALVRFENTVEVSWKLLKTILLEDYGVNCASPKQCLREAYANNLISYNDTWLKLIDRRNQLTHMYDSSVAQSVYRELPHVIPTLKELEYLTSTTSF
jgi:nucleotidyltransferase substrate binding protein (TIGR01987 family)